MKKEEFEYAVKVNLYGEHWIRYEVDELMATNCFEDLEEKGRDCYLYEIRRITLTQPNGESEIVIDDDKRILRSSKNV